MPAAACVPHIAGATTFAKQWRRAAGMTVEFAFGQSRLTAYPTWTNVFADVLDVASGDPIDANRGRKNPLDRYPQGAFTFTLNNRSQNYDPDNASSTYAGNLLPGTPVQIRSRVATTAVVLARGFVEGFYPEWPAEIGKPVCRVVCYGVFGLFATEDAATSAYMAEVTADKATARVWYRLGEGVGPVMTDSSGNGRHGTYTGTLAWATGLPRGETTQALNCAARDVRGAVPSGGKVSAPPYTVELSVTLPARGNDGVVYIQEDDFAVYYAPAGDGALNGHVALDCLLGLGGEMARGALVTAGSHHIVFTRTLVGMRMWVDGVEQLPMLERTERLPAGATATNIGGPAASPTAPTFGNAQTGSGLTATAPTNSAGDLIVVATYNATSISGGFTQTFAVGAMSVWYKYSTGAEPANWTLTGTNVSWVTASYSGAGPLAYPTVGAGPGTGVQSLTALTVDVENSLFMCVTFDGNTGGVNTPTAGFTSRGMGSTTTSAVRISDKTHAGGLTTAASVTGITNAGGIAGIYVAPKVLGSGFTGVVDEVLVYDGELPDARIAAHAAAWLNAWAGDTTGARLGRHLDFAGWPVQLRQIDTGQSLMSAYAGGSDLLAVMQDCETAEQGRMFEGRDGSVVFRDRLSSSTRTTESTIQRTYSRAANPYLLPVQTVRNLEQTRNLIQVTRAGGPTFMADDATLRGKTGTRKLAVTLQVTTDAAASGAVTWLRDRLKNPLTRVVVLRVDALADPSYAMLAAIIGDEIGTRVQLTHTTNKGGTVSIVGLLDDIHNKIVRDGWLVEYWLDQIEVQSPVPSW